ncbi:hypothetical protein NLJ89_g9407 [Agrocybe chaxingu]|uniref:Fungal-type protein kinase domain-containing protein n=1 Tax=Agrocybe chaxingu TaxID=84603 RepID=A0A9W8JTC0_9AGAR|nr:hypothetical protein NLJ89_g9407 [Agrocybe chaxingu]
MAFIETSGLYNRATQHWSKFDATADAVTDAELCLLFLQIFRKVIKSFHIKKRDVIDTHSATLGDGDGSWNIYPTTPNTLPGLLIFGSGPNFHPGKGRPKPINYMYCASPCEVMTEANLNEQVVIQAGAHARECFCQQGNRLYVYSLVVTEKRAFLLQFDRNGVLRCKDVNIHEKPQDLVYLILLVCSPDHSVLGFDTNVYWRGQKRYIKALGEENKLVEYEVVNSYPSGRRRVIKDAWHRLTASRENEMLERVKGLKYVSQIVACEEIYTLASLRGMRGKPLPGGLTDKVLRRLVLEAHGTPIWQFKTPKQFLGAFRDAVVGHRNLWDNGILHRDVSINNILISDDDAEEGSRGTLIDLDLATCFGPDIGTLEYQSIFIMMSEEEKEQKPPAVLLPHDHLDDLESFWVFCRVCMGYDKHGSEVKCPTIKRWESEHLIIRLHRRIFLLMDNEWLQHDEVVHNFGAVFQTLFDGLRELMNELFRWKFRQRKEGKLPVSYEQMNVLAKTHYARFLELLDKALVDLAEEGENVPAPAAVSISIAPSHQPAPLSSHKPSQAAGVKRKREKRDEGDSGVSASEAPSSKRPRTRLEIARLAEEKENMKPQTRSRAKGVKTAMKNMGRCMRGQKAFGFIAID